MRTFERTENTSLIRAFSDDVCIRSDAEFILLMMGFDQYFIDNMPMYQLEEIAQTPWMSTTVSYSIETQTGELIYASPEEARNHEATQMRSRNIIDPETELVTGSMRLVFSVHQVPNPLEAYNSRFRFSTSAHWFNMPQWRMTDSLGVASTYMVPLFETRSSWISYMNGRILVQRTAQSFAYTTNHGFHGLVALFPLPSGVHADINEIHDFRVQVHFVGEISQPRNAVTARSYATYTHVHIGMNMPSISISSTGSIGISNMFGWQQSRRQSPSIIIRYRP
jgi:hypothetical protein